MASAQLPQISGATPHTQDGLTLLAISRGDSQGHYQYPIPPDLSFLSGPSASGYKGGYGLWIIGRKPAVPKMVKGHLLINDTMNPPTAQAKAADGVSIFIQCQQVNEEFYSNTPQQRPLYLVTVPAGYPTPFGAINIIVMVANNEQAHWTLIDLPPSTEAIRPDTPFHTKLYYHGVTLQAKAWIPNNPGYFPNGPRGGNQSVVNYQLTGTVPPKSLWLVRILKQHLEWEPKLPAESTQMYVPPAFRYQNAFTTYFGSSGIDSNLPFNPYPTLGTIAAPYARFNHVIRLTGQLVKIAARQEQVTFHNLNIRLQKNPYLQSQPNYHPPPSYIISARPQTVSTPSGISVTLLPYSKLPLNMQSMQENGSIQMLIRFNTFAPSITPISIPWSPLAREFHKDITLSIGAIHPLMLTNIMPVGLSYGPAGETSKAPMEYLITMQEPGPMKMVHEEFRGHEVTTFQQPVMPKYLSSLTINLSQLAVLHTVPISFIVPIQAPPPAARPFHPMPRIILP